MKVIDILNKMSNGTLEDGFKFCFRNEVYTYRKKDDSIRDSCFNKIGGRNVIEDFLNNEVLLFKENDAKEVETIEENKEIEELPNELINDDWTYYTIKFYKKINELVRAVNKLNKEREGK